MGMSCNGVLVKSLISKFGIPLLIDFPLLLAFVQYVQFGGPPIGSVLERHVKDF